MSRFSEITGYVWRGLGKPVNLFVTVIACGLSLLPLSALLMIYPALTHRLALTPEADLRGTTTLDVLAEVADSLVVPRRRVERA